jgi:selenocysteine lyase/cysteine desulfurase
MTKAYHEAQHIIKKHVNAGPSDVLITSGFGMTGVLVKFQRILNLKAPEKNIYGEFVSHSKKPVVFITHMEHHSNQTSWYETIADVVIIEPDENLFVSAENLRKSLKKYNDRPFKIGSFTACSNVTGVRTPIHELARAMHEFGGVCFIDYAASAPYDEINMHPGDPMEKLDAILFSPHKFLGGPGSSGVLIFDASMYNCEVPDNPGGGTVDWTNPWGKYKYVDDIETREDGGTPGFLQSIRTALCFELKNQMGIENIRNREEELLELAFEGLDKIKGLKILANNIRNRLGVISFYIEGIHYNLIVRFLNDKYGIQVRGGCACAGTYGHFLLEVSYEKSKEITDKINHGDLSEKPGWVRWSLHPTTTNSEVYQMIVALNDIALNIDSIKKDYIYNNRTNVFWHTNEKCDSDLIEKWFLLS